MSGSFTTVRTQGAILPPDLLQRIVDRGPGIEGLTAEAYHLNGETVGEAMSRTWVKLQKGWVTFREGEARLPENDPGTSLTRERWLLSLFQELGYGRLQTAKAIEVGGKAFPISHLWGEHVPLHLVGCRVDIDRRTPRVAGAAGASPHGLVQEFLNRSVSHLWGFVSNGFTLRILRDNASLTRQAFVEFDLRGMLDGEVYSDFALLWLLCHESRVEGDNPAECWLERWSVAARDQGTRVLDGLRAGVEHAIEALGAGFLAHSANNNLRERIRNGVLIPKDYYRQLLRLVYRLLFLMVAEERSLLLDPGSAESARRRYLDHYSLQRLRRLAGRQRGTRHGDLWQGLLVVMRALGHDAGCPALGLPALGSFLWAHNSLPDFDPVELSNEALLAAVRALAFASETGSLRPVDYRNLGAEELGSVYESLLELHPVLDGTFTLETAAGSERRTTASYYTPSSLVDCLLDSALDPVLDEAAHKPNPESAILSLKICDPACGSGHFLIAAAQRIGKRLAGVRTGDIEPSPEALRTAVRDVVGHCLYGVDLNPMAVELCKVSLWLEGTEPGRPLSFLDHRIQVGNSLLGTTPALMAGGIPDDAFVALEGDDRALVRDLKRRNRRERAGQTTLFAGLGGGDSALTRVSALASEIDALGDASITEVHRKEETWRRLAESAEYARARLLADAWCAAFVWRRVNGGLVPVTQEVLRRIEQHAASIPRPTVEEIERLRSQYRFFEWHLAFPDVFPVSGMGEGPTNETAGWTGGFDVVLGNPPWERIKLQEREWFAACRPDIAEAPNAAARRRLIADLREADPALWTAWLEDSRQAEGESHFVRLSGRYPLCGRGDVNTYAVFAELMHSLIGPRGRVGCIVPLGIATDDTTKHFFGELLGGRGLASLFGFENEERVFPAVHHATRFCLLTITGSARPEVTPALACFLRQVSDLTAPERVYRLSAEDVALLNPNTRTCPVFRTRRDVEITKGIYRRVPVLLREGPPEENPWGLTFRAMFHMSNDSGLFCTRAELEEDGWQLEANVFVRGVERYLPLYEAKMVHHFDHRFGTYEGQTSAQARQNKLPEVTDNQHSDSEFATLPEYWVPETEVTVRLAPVWSYGWLLGWRNICRSTDQRTVIATVLPRVGVGHSAPLLLPSLEGVDAIAGLVANLSAFVQDYAARQKVAGANLTYGYLSQLPILSPTVYSSATPWDCASVLTAWVGCRVLELTYTAADMKLFAGRYRYNGPPFRWDDTRRSMLRAELDAAFFHLYQIGREDVEYILETFPIVRRNDERQFGEYRTKRLIFECYDAMARAIETGVPYQTVLDPPPADPRVAHGAPAVAIAPLPAATVLPFGRLGRRPTAEERYVTAVPLLTLKAAAGSFSEAQQPEFDDWVEVKAEARLRKGMFVAQVVGPSMEPVIPQGAYCLFGYPVHGTREGKVVLVQAQGIDDPDTGGGFTVKRYHSEKHVDEDGGWHHSRVVLRPDNPAFEPIVLQDVEEGEFKVVAELVEVLGV